MSFIRSIFTWSSFSVWVVVVVVLSVAAAYYFTTYIDIQSGGPTESQNVTALQAKEWTHIGTRYSDGRDIHPVRASDFKLQFGTDGKFTGSTDCNNIFGTYTSGRRTLALSDIGSTKKFCAWSEEQDYTRLLGDVIGYYFNEKGELLLELEYNSGVMVYH